MRLANIQNVLTWSTQPKYTSGVKISKFSLVHRTDPTPSGLRFISTQASRWCHASSDQTRHRFCGSNRKNPLSMVLRPKPPNPPSLGFENQTDKFPCTRRGSTPVLSPNQLKPSCTPRMAWLTNVDTCPASAKCHDTFMSFTLQRTDSLLELAIAFLLDLTDAVFITMCSCSSVRHVDCPWLHLDSWIPQSKPTRVHPSSPLGHQHKTFAWPSPHAVDHRTTFHSYTSWANRHNTRAGFSRWFSYIFYAYFGWIFKKHSK
jgi:hypothetical protein